MALLDKARAFRAALRAPLVETFDRSAEQPALSALSAQEDKAPTIGPDASVVVRPTGEASRHAPAPWDADDWRAYFDERAGIREFDAGIPRPAAEARAFDCCIVEWMNRHPVQSYPGRCHACGGDGAQEALVPCGTTTAGHVWLHGRCWRAWFDARKSKAAAALKALGIDASQSEPIQAESRT